MDAQLGMPMAQNLSPTVLTNVGSVFGTQVPGWNMLPKQEDVKPQPITLEDANSQRFIALESAIRDLKSSIELKSVEIKQIKDFIDQAIYKASVKTVEPLIVTSNVPNPLSGTAMDVNYKGVAVIEKKKPGRPKKVI